ncbi:tRNA (5-methylaminomethyl-2-thiouridine)(34)-methyltransferase MnmD [Baaleninema simplex]|uniref:tRNA (5-methylaminomethyl-2-thiouridine)(34)-methyltransferase MnmD n=1 Tax=Baaleninema simplex TaxID=2862350 RepID=UPI00035E7E19|nr:MnmC family methyltransferase [Baaleninema simplex]
MPDSIDRPGIDRVSLIRPFSPHSTADGSRTFYSDEFGEFFHSHHGAKQEAESKFVRSTFLPDRARKPVVYLLDICYGLGYNTAAALETIWRENPYCQVVWMGLESDATVAPAAVTHHLLDTWSNDVQWRLAEIARHREFEDVRFRGKLWLGDARETIVEVYESGFRADAIFLDPFSPPTCPQLWTVEFLQYVADCLKPTGYLATYSCAASVRSALIEVGLKVGSTVPVGRKTPGTVASWSDRHLQPLSQREREHLQTRAAVPYRDLTLSDCAETIRQRRQAEQETSDREPTTQWKKRWAVRKSFNES